MSNSKIKAEEKFDAGRDVNMTGKVVVVTGASRGTGRSALLALASLPSPPSRIYLLDHPSTSLASASLASLASRPSTPTSRPPSTNFLPCDLSSLNSVRRAALSILSAEPQGVHVLVLNAGVVCLVEALSREGVEIHLGMNHLAHAALARWLRPSLEKVAGRVILVVPDEVVADIHPELHVTAFSTSEGGVRAVDENLDSVERRRYLQSKLVSLLHTRRTARSFPAISHIAIVPGSDEDDPPRTTGGTLARFSSWLGKRPAGADLAGSPWLNHLWACGAKLGTFTSGGVYRHVGEAVDETGKSWASTDMERVIWGWTEGVLDWWCERVEADEKAAGVQKVVVAVGSNVVAAENSKQGVNGDSAENSATGGNKHAVEVSMAGGNGIAVLNNTGDVDDIIAEAPTTDQTQSVPEDAHAQEVDNRPLEAATSDTKSSSVESTLGPEAGSTPNTTATLEPTPKITSLPVITAPMLEDKLTSDTHDIQSKMNSQTVHSDHVREDDTLVAESPTEETKDNARQDVKADSVGRDVVTRVEDQNGDSGEGRGHVPGGWPGMVESGGWKQGEESHVAPRAAEGTSDDVSGSVKPASAEKIDPFGSADEDNTAEENDVRAMVNEDADELDLGVSLAKPPNGAVDKGAASVLEVALTEQEGTSPQEVESTSSAAGDRPASREGVTSVEESARAA
ncbi:NAD(P)-binding protein [Gonapodya prolifera JEL478]|uniref:NAD(P)-binding protein n=1 Tax=Gonapodya prolifera (strain JEL478) TaxID=1344416 RepID=A0A139ARG1_GONPJ|nr:NAD(P)-binding protein [Gonapodya prolifera JEL478]|eukprot:KXS19327.1 NAD(P)-binding protein [Gonapodya prolifera JEL478]